MTKEELIKRLWEKHPRLKRKEVVSVIDHAFGEIERAIRREKKFMMPNFGTFLLRSRKGRRGVNPQTGERIRLPSSKTIGFRPALMLRNKLNGRK